MTRFICTLLLCVLTLTACHMKPTDPSNIPRDLLPRNISLKAFDPHRKDFSCVHEADRVPPLDPEADTWFQQGLAVTSRDLWPNQRNYPEAVRLWTKAAERKHWKAMMHLAGVLIEGDGTEPYVVPPDVERAVRIVEDAMRLGVPAAFDMMGNYHQSGFVKTDISRAYAFWELAADMGSPSALTHLGRALSAAYDNPKDGIWANEAVGLKMLKCAFAQGYGKAAYELALYLEVVKKDFAPAVRVYHEGVKFGSEDCANSLDSLFRGAKMKNGGPTKDPGRAERYAELAQALWHNPDLRFPNLDKALPLPPAPLPKWGGSLEVLKGAAMAVVPVPVPKPSAASQRTGRAHIPQGLALPEYPEPPRLEALGLNPNIGVLPQYERTAVRFSGYWLPQLLQPRSERHAEWNEWQQPQRYARGESFEDAREGLTRYDGRVMWHYLGVAEAVPAPEPHPALRMRVARQVRPPEQALTCMPGEACPRTGIWMARLPADHRQAAAFNHWSRQGYFERGQRLHIQATQALKDGRGLRWHWLDGENDAGFAGFRDLTLTDLHDGEGNQLA
jgi:TPR repeat protein